MGANNSSFIDGDANRIFPSINNTSTTSPRNTTPEVGDSSFQLNVTTPMPNRIQLSSILSENSTAQENTKPKNPIISANSMRFTKIATNQDILNQNLYKADMPDEDEDDEDKKEPTSTLLSQIPDEKLMQMMQASFQPNSRQVELLASLLPEELLQRIVEETVEQNVFMTHPELTNFEGVILGIRFVGFSTTITNIVETMDQNSAKNLGEKLSSQFCNIMKIIHEFGGTVESFGETIFALFGEKTTAVPIAKPYLLHALDCGMRILSAFQPSKEISSLKLCAALGPTSIAYIGGDNQTIPWKRFVYGECMEDVTEGLDRCKDTQFLCPKDSYKLVSKFCSGKSLIGRYVLLKRVMGPALAHLQPITPFSPIVQREALKSSTREWYHILESFVDAPTRDMLWNTSNFSTEIRTVCCSTFVLHCKWKNVISKKQQAAHSLLLEIQRIVFKYGGLITSIEVLLQQVNIEICFGYPKARLSDTIRAVRASIEIKNICSKLNMPFSNSISLSDAFCGLLGDNSMKWHLLVLSSGFSWNNKVFESCTSKQMGLHLCDEQVVQLFGASIEYNPYTPLKKLKLYTPAVIADDLDVCDARFLHFGKNDYFISRKEILDSVDEQVQLFLKNGTHISILVEGEYGKTTLVNQLVSHYKSIATVQTFGMRKLDKGGDIPFASVSKLFRSIMCTHYPALKPFFKKQPNCISTEMATSIFESLIKDGIKPFAFLLNDLFGTVFSNDMQYNMSKIERRERVNQIFVCILKEIMYRNKKRSSSKLQQQTQQVVQPEKIILLADDLQFMDEDSIYFVVELVKYSHLDNLLLLTTASQQLKSVEHNILKQSSTLCISIPPLSLQETHLYLKDNLKVENVDTNLVQVLLEASKGNPIELSKWIILLQQNKWIAKQQNNEKRVSLSLRNENYSAKALEQQYKRSAEGFNPQQFSILQQKMLQIASVIGWEEVEQSHLQVLYKMLQTNFAPMVPLEVLIVQCAIFGVINNLQKVVENVAVPQEEQDDELNAATSSQKKSNRSKASQYKKSETPAATKARESTRIVKFLFSSNLCEQIYSQLSSSQKEVMHFVMAQRLEQIKSNDYYFHLFAYFANTTRPVEERDTELFMAQFLKKLNQLVVQQRLQGLSKIDKETLLQISIWIGKYPKWNSKWLPMLLELVEQVHGYIGSNLEYQILNNCVHFLDRNNCAILEKVYYLYWYNHFLRGKEVKAQFLKELVSANKYHYLTMSLLQQQLSPSFNSLQLNLDQAFDSFLLSISNSVINPPANQELEEPHTVDEDYLSMVALYVMGMNYCWKQGKREEFLGLHRKGLLFCRKWHHEAMCHYLAASCILFCLDKNYAKVMELSNDLEQLAKNNHFHLFVHLAQVYKCVVGLCTATNESNQQQEFAKLMTGMFDFSNIVNGKQTEERCRIYKVNEKSQSNINAFGHYMCCSSHPVQTAASQYRTLYYLNPCNLYLLIIDALIDAKRFLKSLEMLKVMSNHCVCNHACFLLDLNYLRGKCIAEGMRMEALNCGKIDKAKIKQGTATVLSYLSNALLFAKQTQNLPLEMRTTAVCVPLLQFSNKHHEAMELMHIVLNQYLGQASSPQLSYDSYLIQQQLNVLETYIAPILK